MKITLLTAVCTMLFFYGFCQQLEKSPGLTRDDHMRISKHRRTTGWILLGGGAGLTAISYLGYANTDGKGAPTAWLVMTAAGYISMIASIPVFISAGSHRSKARKMDAGVSLQDAWPGHFLSKGWPQYPAVSVRLSL